MHTLCHILFDNWVEPNFKVYGKISTLAYFSAAIKQRKRLYLVYNEVLQTTVLKTGISQRGKEFICMVILPPSVYNAIA